MTDDQPARELLLRRSPFSFGNKLARSIWGVVWLVLFRPSPRPAHAWRCLLLRIFGAKIGRGTTVHASARIWAPWNLTMGDHSCMGENVDCYSAASVTLEEWSMVSQYSYLCTASHDYEIGSLPGFQRPIVVKAHAWVAADVYVGPGVTIEQGAVVGARSSVYKDVPAWTVVGGNPARFIRVRKWRPVAVSEESP